MPAEIPKLAVAMPPLAKVNITWFPGHSDPGQPVYEVRAVDEKGLPVMLSEQQQVQAFDAFMDQVMPHANAAVQGFAMACQLLEHVVGADHTAEIEALQAQRAALPIGDTDGRAELQGQINFLRRESEGRVKVGGASVMHPDGGPVVSDGWVQAVEAFLRG